MNSDYTLTVTGEELANIITAIGTVKLLAGKNYFDFTQDQEKTFSELFDNVIKQMVKQGDFE